MIPCNGHEYLGHRLAWFYFYGEWPRTGIDHIDGDPSNNRIGNLREADQSQNIANSRKRNGVSSSYKGVHFDKERGLWAAQIMKNYKQISLGRFTSEEDAAAAYVEAASRLFGEFARFS